MSNFQQLLRVGLSESLSSLHMANVDLGVLMLMG